MRPASPMVEKALRYLLPNVQVVFWAAIFFGVLSMGPRLMNVDGDLGRHLAIGEMILSTGDIPTRDVFSHSMAGAPLTPHEWLAQVLFALAHRLLGLDGVVVLTAAVIATAFWLTLRLSIQRSGSLLVGLAVGILAAGASSLHWLTRPHVFTFLYLALWLCALERMRQGRGRAWMWLPALMLLWVNTHGAFIAGFVVWLIYLAGWAWERWVEGEKAPSAQGFLLGGAAALAATLANPSGAHIWATSVGYVGNDYLVGHTAEYLSPDFHNSSAWLFLLMIVAALAAVGLAGRRRNATDLMLVCAWLAMGLYSARNIPLFAICAAPVIAAAVWETLKNLAGRAALARKFVDLDRRLLMTEASLHGWAWMGAALLGTSLALHSGVALDAQRQGNTFDGQVFPVAAVDWLEAHPQPGEPFNYFPWGGYLLYRAWPDVNVFIDGQTDFYGEALTREYEQALQVEPGWERILAKYQVDWVIWPVEGRLTDALAADSAWTQVYRDGTAVIFARR